MLPTTHPTPSFLTLLILTKKILNDPYFYSLIQNVSDVVFTFPVTINNHPQHSKVRSSALNVRVIYLK